MKNKFSIVLMLIFMLNINRLAKDSNSTIYISFVGMNMDYKEYDNSGKLIDSEKSSYAEMVGFETLLEYRFDKSKKSYSQIDCDLMLLGGETTYKGSYLNSTLPYGSVVSDTKNIVIDVSMSYKHTTVLNMSKFTYGLGIGYHYWDRILSSTQTEIYTWYSVRPMIGFGYMFQKDLSLAVNVEYQYGFNTLMSATNPNLDFVLGGVNTLNLSIPIIYKYDKNLDVFFEAVFQTQTIQKSGVEYDGTSGYYEPDSTSYNNYIKLGIAFKF